MNFDTLFGGIGRALSNRRFRRYWTANAISTIGRWIYRTAVGWMVWDLTKDPKWLGIVAFADIFPMARAETPSVHTTVRTGAHRR